MGDPEPPLTSVLMTLDEYTTRAPVEPRCGLVPGASHHATPASHEIVMILAVTTDGLRNVETSEVTLGAGAT